MFYTLILILSLKSQFHHDIDVKPIVQKMVNQEECMQLGETLSKKIKSKNPDLEVEIVCAYTRF